MKIARRSDLAATGYDWIGDMPSDWQLVRIGQLFTERRTKVSDVEYQPLSVTKNGIVPQMERVAKTDDNDNRKLVLSGDFVINSRSDRKGSSGLSLLDGSVSLINTVLCIGQDIVPKFAHHLLKSYAFQEEFYRMGNGLVADLWTTKFGAMKSICIPLPNVSEQQQIVDYLEKELARIDSLIERKSGFIRILQEKRDAAIAHAVTMGIVAGVPTKRSGEEWLRFVPAHWDVVPPTFLFCESKQRALPDDQMLSATQKYGVIPLAEFEALEQRQVTMAFTNLDKRKHVEVGDFVISMRSMDGGLERARAIGSVRSSYTVLKPVEHVEGRYFGALLKSAMFIQGLRLTSNFIRDGQDLNFSHVRKLKLPLPPFAEQVAIANHIERETSRIDRLIEATVRSLELLREHRTALVTAAVTGKIDVRTAA